MASDKFNGKFIQTKNRGSTVLVRGAGSIKGPWELKHS